MTDEFGVTNVVLKNMDLVEPEAMTPEMKLVFLKDGNVVFINTKEEYQRYVADGLIQQ